MTFENSEESEPFVGTYKPPELTTKEKVIQFFYNSENGAIMGRTPRNWGALLIFYTIFYGILAFMFYLCMEGLLLSVGHKIPSRILDDSLIGTTPGLGFRPAPFEKGDSEMVLIWYKGSDPGQYEHWAQKLDVFLEPYRDSCNASVDGVSNLRACDYDNLPSKSDACCVNITDWYPCTKENLYGYPEYEPCVFIKINKIYGWVPEYHNVTDLPEEMPQFLKDHITNVTEADSERKAFFVLQINTIWLSCEGEKGPDKEALGPVEYIPSPGFPGYFYPYLNQDGYISPLVALHLRKPATGIVITVICKAWARNLEYDPQENIGTITFQVMID